MPQPAPRTTTTPPDESDLVGKLRSGDDAAYETLVRTYGPRMLAVARRYLPEEADAQDALQEAFVLVFRSIGGFEGQSRLSTWLHRIVVNCALMKIRSRSRRPEDALDADTIDAMSAGHRASEGRAAVSAPASRAELRERIHECLARLPEDYRAILRLRDVEGLELREIATLLDIGLSTVKNRVHRGRHALREMLGPVFDEVHR